MTNFSEMVTQSVLARALAILILFLTMIAAIAIATIDLLYGKPIPDVIQTIIGIGIGTAGTLVGVNFGVVLQPLQPKESSKQP